MSEFAAIDLTEDAPAGICQACAKTGLQHGPTSTLIAYCPHALRGAYRILDRPWKVIAGIERGIFRDVIARGLTAGELRIELARELSQIIQDDANRSTKH